MNPSPARTALVTGASRGIGRELALGLARAGLGVALLARDGERLAQVAAEIEGSGGRAFTAAADVTDPEAVARAVVQAGAALGGIDLLVNNAGRIDTEVPLWQADVHEWRDVLLTNVYGPFLVAHAVVPGMIAAGGGRVVDLNSGAGIRDVPVATAYGVAKTALFRIGGAIHAAGHDHGLRSFELSPGVVRTDMTASMAGHARRTEWTEASESVDLVLAIARGELDALSGCYLRAGTDTVASLRAAIDSGELSDQPRRLRLASGR